VANRIAEPTAGSRWIFSHTRSRTLWVGLIMPREFEFHGHAGLSRGIHTYVCYICGNFCAGAVAAVAIK